MDGDLAQDFLDRTVRAGLAGRIALALRAGLVSLALVGCERVHTHMVNRSGTPVRVKFDSTGGRQTIAVQPGGSLESADAELFSGSVLLFAPDQAQPIFVGKRCPDEGILTVEPSLAVQCVP